MIRNSIRALAVAAVSVEIVPVALLVAGSVVYQPVLPIAFGVAVLFWPLRWLAQGDLSVRTPADWAIALLALMIPVTLWATALPDTTHLQVLRLLTGLALFYAVVNWGDSLPRVRLLAAGILLGGLALAAIAPAMVDWYHQRFAFLPSSIYARFPQLVNEPFNPNVIAGDMAIVLPCALGIFVFNWGDMKWAARALVGVAVLGMGSILVLTQSRGALLGMGAATIALVLLRWRRGWIAIVLVALGVFVVVQSVGLATLLDVLLKNDALGGTEGRLEVWSRAIYMIQDFPFTGVGMGSFGPVADVLYPFFLAAPGTIPHAHNLFLQVAVDLGLPGLVGWLAILMVVTAAAWQVYRYGRRTGNLYLAGLGAGLFCAQVALMTHGMIDAVVWGMERSAVIVWALWGLTLACWNVYRKRLSEDQEIEHG